MATIPATSKTAGDPGEMNTARNGMDVPGASISERDGGAGGLKNGGKP